MSDNNAKIEVRLPNHFEIIFSHFTVEDLKAIILAAGAPPISNTFNAIAIAQNVSIMIHNRQNPPLPPSSEMKNARKLGDEVGMALSTLEKSLPEVIKRVKRWQQRYLNMDSGYSPEMINNEQSKLQQVETLHTAVVNARNALIWKKTKTKGQHGPSALTNICEAELIFARLGWAWDEAGQGQGSEQQRYDIISKCLEVSGVSVLPDTIRKSLAKHWLNYPTSREKLGRKVVRK